MNRAQNSRIFAQFADLGITSRDEQLNTLTNISRVRFESRADPTVEQAAKVIRELDWASKLPTEPINERQAQVDILTRPDEDPWAKGSAA